MDVNITTVVKKSYSQGDFEVTKTELNGDLSNIIKLNSDDYDSNQYMHNITEKQLADLYFLLGQANESTNKTKKKEGSYYGLK